MTNFTNNFDLNKAHRDSFFKNSENNIEKASRGEGSKGGKVIGHTSSGKPIYEHRPYEHHSKEELHKLADKKAGRDRMNAINELSLRYEQSSGKKASILALDRKEPYITKEKQTQPTHKHISDMSKDEMHTQAEKMGIKGHKDMNQKELEKKLVEANVDKELEKVKNKHSLNQKLNSYLDKYPDDATSWSQADDGVRDMARAARNHYNEHELDVLEDDPKAMKPLDFQSLKTPSEWNTKGKKYIQEVVSKMSDKTKRSFEQQMTHQLGDKVEKSVDIDSLQKAYSVLGLR